jgi:hypothetical protein
MPVTDNPTNRLLIQAVKIFFIEMKHTTSEVFGIYFPTNRNPWENIT